MLASPIVITNVATLPFRGATQRQASKARDHCHVETHVVPNAVVIRLIDANIAVEDVTNQRKRSDPAMPDPREEARGIPG